MKGRETIFALSSGQGPAGVAVIRLSGPATMRAIDRLQLGPLRPRTARLVRITDPGSDDIIDSALALFFPAPHSFSGEDVLELHVHGGRAVVAAVLGALSHIDGLRLADAGEFTRRAFHHGKIDLTQAEGLAGLISAETEAQRQQAVRVAGGALKCLYERWRQDLIVSMALVEAAIDFSDEADVATDAVAQAQLSAAALHSAITVHLNDQRRGEILRDGFRVVIAGPPNAGKSSLLNALAQRDVAIVSPEPGTTRDVIEARLDLGGYPVIVSDTAGIRSDPGGAVEREGIRRSFASSSEADLILWLVDSENPAARPPHELLGQGVEILCLRSKADLPSHVTHDGSLQGFSSLTGIGLPQLIQRLTEAAGSSMQAGAVPSLITARQRLLVAEAASRLADFLAGPLKAPELRAEDLRRAAQAIGRLTGHVDVEDVLDQVFSAFCIGK